jgi:2-polyprenyl-3-methyl-5-hydroxy-6-metoxy-1,4-benzoquinol methylase
MIESQNPEIDVQELMAKIRSEVERRKAQPIASPGGPPSLPHASAPEAVAPTSHRLRTNITEVLNSARQKGRVSSRIPTVIRPFFRNQGGVNSQLLYAIELQTQQIDDLCDELANLRQASHRDVADLRSALADSLNHIKTLQEETSSQRDELATLQQASRIEIASLRSALADSLNHIKTLQGETSSQRDELATLQQASRTEIASLRSALADSLNHIKTLQEETSKQVSGVHGILKEQQAATHRQIRQLDNQFAELIDRVAPKITSLDADALYLAFENQFRGSREDIKGRQRIYLPYLAGAGVGTVDKPLLDIGCGRGEWLEILRENGHTARGVDSNASMISICRELGLDAIASDALAYLKTLPDQSLGAVTGMHVIEHLPFPVLLKFLAQARRVLQTGGLAIFETPNCKNLVVGACNFYSDPTHQNPVFPDTAKFLLEHVGFSSADILYLAPAPGSPFRQEAPDTGMLHHWFFGPRDFAVIAKK